MRHTAVAKVTSIEVGREKAEHAPAVPKPEGDEAATGVFAWAKRIYEVAGSGGRLAPMEGMRGLAVLMVFFVHYHALFGRYVQGLPALWRPSHFMGSIGNAGVDLFFVISGYLIYGALLRHNGGLLGFLRRRVQRIYPAFLSVLMIYVALSIAFPSRSRLHRPTLHDSLEYLLANVLLLPGIFHIRPIITVAWSLSYEFAFYVLGALVLWGLRMWVWAPRWRVAFLCAVWLSYLCYSFTAAESHIRALMFVIGMLLHEALQSDRFRQAFTRRRESAVVGLFLISLMATFVLDFRPGWFSFLPGWESGRSGLPGVPGYQGPYKTLLFSISMFWLSAFAFAFAGRLHRVCSWAPLRYLGNMSYSYYLIHGLTLQGLAMAAQGAHAPAVSPALLLGALPCGLVLTWLTATLLFAAIEKPFSFSRRPRSSGVTPLMKRDSSA